MRAGASEVLGYAAEALLLAGDLDAAQCALDEALQVASDLGERVYLPQLLLLEAAIARQRGCASAGGGSMRRAADEARVQEAPWLELLALVDLCDDRAATAVERARLAVLVAQFAEAQDLSPITHAQSLLSALNSS
jgi:ATP/maltotriose-dependent transcriptional regulator MalT